MRFWCESSDRGSIRCGVMACASQYHGGVSENGSKKKTIGFIGIIGVVASIVWFALRPRLKAKDGVED